jgi:hypothetical protein
VILALIWPFFPESPYWLVRRGRQAEARKALQRIYGFKETAYYDIEITRMEEEIRITSDLHRNTDDRAHRGFLGIELELGAQCFDVTNRKRTLTAIFAASSQQMIGATFVIGYATYFFELIGFATTSQHLSPYTLSCS